MSRDEEVYLIRRSLERAATEVELKDRTLKINPRAFDQLLTHSIDFLALLLTEADRIARGRSGDDIQRGDVEEAKRRLEGKSKGSYWSVAAGAALLGAGLQGLADSLLTTEAWYFILVYSLTIVIGLSFLYWGAPRR